MLFIMLSLPACTSPWTRADTSQFEIWKDLQKCQGDAVQQFPDTVADSNSSKERMTEEQRRTSRQHVIDQCMSKKGYTPRSTAGSS